MDLYGLHVLQILVAKVLLIDFNQIKPKILITCDYYYYNGKKIDILDKIPEITKKIKSIKKIIVFPYNNKFKK